MAPSTTG